MNPIDRHPDSGLPMIEAAGAWRVLGCLPPAPALGASALATGAILTPDKWRECNYHADWPVIATANQGATESCVGHAIQTIFSYSWLQSGLKFKVFSPTYVYGLINHGVDRGSSISDAVNALKAFGICEARYVPEGMIFRSQFPAEAAQNGRRHRPVDCFQVRGYDELCSQLTLGFPLATGVLVGRDFGALDDEGVCPVPESPVGGHALAVVGLKYSKKLSDWLVLVQNSWSDSWGFRDATGQGGFAYLCRRHFERCFFDTWAVCGVQQDPDDPDDDTPVAH